MVKKHTLTVSVSEIKTLELRCNNCAGMVSLPLGYQVADFIKCPGCGQTLMEGGDRYSALFKLCGAFVQWNRFQDLPLDLTFTVDLPSEDR